MNYEGVLIDKDSLQIGMTLFADIFDAKGNILISKETVLKDYHIFKIKGLERYSKIAIKKLIKTSQKTKNSVSTKKTIKTPINIIRQETKTKIKSSLSQFNDNSNPNMKILFEITEQILDSILSSENLLYEIDRIQSSDDYLYNHTINTTILSLLIGISVGLKKDKLISLSKGALFSNIGKLQIDPFLLSKVTELKDYEYDEIKKYPFYGYDFMKKSPDMDEDALDCILHCREKWDGTGYPDGLKAEQISLFAQIVSLASFFDAVCSDRPYESPILPYKAMSLAFDEVNTHFSPYILKKAIRILGYYDVGMFVELKTGEMARIIKINRHKPVLTLIQNFRLNSPSQVYEIDMKRNPSVRIKDVLVKSEYKDKLLGM